MIKWEAAVAGCQFLRDAIPGLTMEFEIAEKQAEKQAETQVEKQFGCRASALDVVRRYYGTNGRRGQET